MQPKHAEFRYGSVERKFNGRLIKFLISTIAVTYLAEVSVMFILPLLPEFTLTTEAFVDATMLSVLIIPVVYLVAFRPLRDYITMYWATQNEKDRLITKLQNALKRVDELEQIIPICMTCGEFKEQQNLLKKAEAYAGAHKDAMALNNMCSSCKAELYPDWSKAS